MDLDESLHGVLDDSVSTAAHSVLSALTPSNIELIDEIIKRSTSATTFLTVFKAYNEVLEERGLNAADDVIYYKFLLKLGVVKGRTWGEKWMAVKIQHGLQPTPSHPSPQRQPLSPIHVRYSRVPGVAMDAVSSDGGDMSFSLSSTKRDQYPHTSIATSHPSSSSTALASVSLHRKQHPSTTTKSRLTPASRGDSSLSPLRSASPLSAIPHPNEISTFPVKQMSKSKALESPEFEETDAWERLRLARDECIADNYRARLLLLRCFDVWWRGTEWVVTTGAQVLRVHNRSHAESYLFLWCKAFKAVRSRQFHAALYSASVLTRRFWSRWQQKRREKRRFEYRIDMGKRLVAVRGIGQRKLTQRTWMKWRHVHHTLLAIRVHEHCVSNLVFRKWTHSLSRIRSLFARYETYESNYFQSTLTEKISIWKLHLGRRRTERQFESIRLSRLCRDSFHLWRKQALEGNLARNLRQRALLFFSLRLWRRALSYHQQVLRRAIAREHQLEFLLLQRMLKYWVVNERFRLFIRVTGIRMLRSTWCHWRRVLQHKDTLVARALVINSKNSRRVISKALSYWGLLYNRCRRAERFGDQHYTSRLLECALYTWRVRLRMQIKSLKQAKGARRFFLESTAWRYWKRALENKRLQSRVPILIRGTIRQYFSRWRRHLWLQKAVATVQWKQDQILFAQCMNQWTRRIVDIKWRELIIVDKRARDTLGKAFLKWKAVRIRLRSNFSLLESIQIVHEEDLKRKIFINWLAAGRLFRRRRLRLEAYQTETNQSIITATWDQWVGRFTVERLRPIEREMIARTRINLLFKAFFIWKTVTKTVPAIRMHSLRLKRFGWDRWRTIMPKAIQAREARNFRKSALLRHTFLKWTIVWKTKIEVRTIMRARYTRLSERNGTQELVQHPMRPTLPSPLSERNRAVDANSHFRPEKKPGHSSRNSEIVTDLTARWLHSVQSDSGRPRARSLSSSSPRRNRDVWERLRQE